MVYEGIICVYVVEVMGYVEVGVKVFKVECVVEMFDELIDVLDVDFELVEVFYVLMLGCQKSYVFNFNSVKKLEICIVCIVKFCDYIIVGKGVLE